MHKNGDEWLVQSFHIGRVYLRKGLCFKVETNQAAHSNTWLRCWNSCQCVCPTLEMHRKNTVDSDLNVLIYM